MDETFAEALDEDTIELMAKSAPLHDIGKVGIPDAILLKPGRLTDEEFKVMKKHPGYAKAALEEAEGVLGTTSFLRHAKDIAFGHHEKWDGSGYPMGLAGEAIPISARLMALADVYDALICKRVYKAAFSEKETTDIIVAGRGTHVDPRVVDAFLRIRVTFREIAAALPDCAIRRRECPLRHVRYGRREPA